jgi:hypothetical protein
VSKQIHLDEQACSVYLVLRATFSPWGLRAPFLESRVATRNSVVRGGRAGTPSPLAFHFWPTYLSSLFIYTTNSSPMSSPVLCSRSCGGSGKREYRGQPPSGVHFSPPVPVEDQESGSAEVSRPLSYTSPHPFLWRIRKAGVQRSAALCRTLLPTRSCGGSGKRECRGQPPSAFFSPRRRRRRISQMKRNRVIVSQDNSHFGRNFPPYSRSLHRQVKIS